MKSIYLDLDSGNRGDPVLLLGTMVVPKLVTGPNDRAIEPNGQVMKPSGALVSELTEKVEPPINP